MDPKPEFPAVAGYVLGIPPDRPDLLLIQLKTLYGPVGFAMTKGAAKQLAAAIAEKAEELTTDRGAN